MKKLTEENGHTFVDIESYQALEEENYRMSAELERYRRFYDYVRDNMINEEDYNETCRFIFSEDDR